MSKKIVIRLLSKPSILIVISTLLFSIAKAEKKKETENHDALIVSGSLSSLNSTNAESAMKFDRSLLETPQSISIIPKVLLDEQQPPDIAEAVKYDAAISQMASFNGIRQRFSARGFELDAKGNYLRNGLVHWFYDIPAIELLDRIEIINGVSALYGPASPGATINMITKMPLRTFSHELRVGAGSFNNKNIMLDTTGPIAGRKDMRYRAVFSGRDSDGFRDNIFVKREAALLSFQWDVTERTMLTTSIDYTRDRRPQDSGLVAINGKVANIPRTRVLNAPWAMNDMTTINASTILDHTLNDFWRTQFAFNYQDFQRDRTDTTIRNLKNNGNYSLAYQRRLDHWQFFTSKLDVISEQPIFNRKNQFLFGVDYIGSHYTQKSTGRTIEIQQRNIFQPQPFPENPYFPMSALPGRSSSDTYGIYLQNVLSITEKWDIMTGIRHDYIHTSPRVGHGFSENHWSPRLGVLFRLRPDISLYTSYLQSVQPNSPVSDQYINAGDRLQPTLSHQVEAGIKKEISPSFMLTGSMFYIVRKNQVTPIDEGLNNRLLQRGEQTHWGVELTANGEIYERLNILGSLSFLNAKITKDTRKELVGNIPVNAPAWSSGIWGEYQLAHKSPWKINMGIFHEAARQGNDANTFKVPAYTRIDTGMSYQKNWRDAQITTRFTIDNLFNANILHAASQTNISVGQPRTFRLSLEIKFT